MNPHSLLRTGLVCATALLLLTAIPAHSQRTVIIPARSASTLDQSTAVVVAPTTNPPVVPLSSPIRDKSNLSQVTLPTSNPDQANISSVSVPLATPPIDPNVVAVQRVETPAPPLDVATIKRLAELRRELSVAESAARARINLPADDLFVAGDSVRIDPLAEPALTSVVEYLERTLKKDVTVKSLHIPGEAGGKEKAWWRTLVLIDWLKANSNLDPGRLRANGPEVLTKAAPKAYALNIGEVEFVNRIELHLE